MDKRACVNVWFDNPGNFLEIGWGLGMALDVECPDNTKLDPTIFLDAERQITSFHIISPLNDSRGDVEETYTIAGSPSHPLTVKYDRARDLWDVHWGHASVDCVDTPNPRIKARVDAGGFIQGVQIRDLRGFTGEIINQDLYPVKPAASTVRQ